MAEIAVHIKSVVWMKISVIPVRLCAMAEDLQPSNNPHRENEPTLEVPNSDSNFNSGQTWWRAILSKHAVMPVLAMLVLCLVVYYPLHAAGFIWDDGYWILNNPTMHHWRDLGVIWFNPMTFMQYYPLSVTAYFLQYQLWGTNALGYHIVSILLQVISALILWRILLRLRLRAAWLAAAIFAINPLVVESVAWVVEQKNLISGILVLAAVWGWIRFAGLDRPEDQLQSAEPVYHWRFYGVAVLFYFLAVCAKTFVCALPAAILVLTWWKLGRITRRHILASIPWFIITAGAGWMAAWRERYGAGAHGKPYHFGVFQHLVIAGKDIWFYAWKLLWPHPILMVYPRWHVHGFTTVDILYPITAALVAVACFAARKKSGRGLFAAVAIYGIMVSPSLGFVTFAGMTITFVADHYFYLGCISLIVLLTQAGAMALAKIQAHWRTPESHNAPQATIRPDIAGGFSKLPVAVSVVVLAALGAVSYAQCRYYIPPIEIWIHELRYDKQCFKAYETLALHDKAHGHIHREFANCQMALKLSKGIDPLANYMLGSLYLEKMNNIPLAMQYLRKSLMVDSYQAKAIVKLAYCYEQQGNWTMAVKDLQRGIELMRGSSRLYLAYGLAQSHLGNTELAVKAYRDAIACNPHNADAHYNLAVLLDKLGHWRQAMQLYRQALELNPRLARAHYFYGLDLLNHGHPAQAAQQFRTVIALSPGHKSAYRFLAQSLKQSGHPQSGSGGIAPAK